MRRKAPCRAGGGTRFRAPGEKILLATLKRQGGTDMTTALIARQFELTHETAHKNLAGITHEESLIFPSPAGNSVNWVAGHIVATRNIVMRTLGAAPIWTADEAAPYERGAKPSRDGTGARPLTEI